MKTNTKKKTEFWNLFNSVRKVTAISLTLVFCYLSIRGTITSDQFIPVFSMVIGYYFGKSTALETPSGTEVNQKNKTN